MNNMLPIPSRKTDANEKEMPDSIIRFNEKQRTKRELMIPRIGKIIDMFVAL